ncbi:MAG: hypothetical protein JWN34_3180 [Bryobacterales bacterium]|nr:hypothetical protein [Bryobacterales bacterium]
MSSRGRKWSWILGGLTGALMVLLWAGLLVLSSDWLRDKIRDVIVSSAAKATGGRVEMEGFQYDWRALRAEIRRFVIHGTEPAGEAPLVETGPVRVEVQIISLLALQVRPTNVEVTNPRVHLIVEPDGASNIPKPKTTGRRKAIPETIVDLKIAKFSLRDGAFTVDAPGREKQRLPLNMTGEGLRALFTFEDLHHRYAGQLALGRLLWNGLGIELATEAVMERNRVVLRNASLKTKSTSVQLPEIVVENLADPVATAKWEASGSAADWVRQVQGKIHGTGTARFRNLSDYEVAGKVDAVGVAVDRFRNMQGTSLLSMNPDRIHLSEIKASALGGNFAGDAEVRDFRIITLQGNASRFRLAQVALAAGAKALPYDAMISGRVTASGSLGGMEGSAQLKLDPVAGKEPVRGIVAITYDPSRQRVDLGNSWVELPHSRVDVSGTLGTRLDVKASSTDVADILPLLGEGIPAFSYGAFSFEGSVSGPLQTAVARGAVKAQKVTSQGVTLDAVSGDVTLSAAQFVIRGGDVSYGAARAKVDGTLGLREWRADRNSAIAATLTASELDLPKLLALGGQRDFPATGQVSAAGQIAGTVGEPKITGDVTVSEGTLHGQPFDSATAHVQGTGAGGEIITGLLASGPKRVNFSGRFEPKGSTFPQGRLDFSLTSNTMPLSEIQLIRVRQPSIAGFGKFHAEGALTITRDTKQQLQVDLATVSGDASLNGVAIEGRSFGDTRLTAATQGDTIAAHFESNAANVAVRGDATMKLAGDYPVDATVRFNDTTIGALAAIALKPETVRKLALDGVAEADVRITGPARHPENMRAEVNVGRLEFRATQGSDAAKLVPGYALKNDGPIRAIVTKQQVKIESAKLKGPQTELALSGALAFAGQSPLSAQVKGQVNLALLEMFDQDLTSSGMLTLDAEIKGSMDAPDVTGRAQLRNGDAHYTGFSNGLSKANGEIVFNGSRATIQSLSGDTGGGRIDASGFAALSNGVVAFRLDAKARDVRVRFQDQGFSSVSDADLTLAGTSQRSLASGAVSVQRVTINPQSDAASLLALSAQPLETASVKPGLLTNMNLDIQITTAPDLVVQTSLTESLQADANLRLRGTATNPAILGRVNVTNGALMFFGNKYTIAQGAISFFNPTKIEPIVNFDLETRARGVDVILTVAGQVNKLNVSYRSDPPLQFSEIVALLATGRTPTDATLASRDTGQTQGLAGLEASSLVSQAIANPVAGRLQRFFGVSRLKIDPRLTGITGSPQARLTIEQQVTPDVLFTYVTDVSNTSTQLIRVEWAMNRNWSALLTREENGKLGLDFSFKKRFK